MSDQQRRIRAALIDAGVDITTADVTATELTKAEEMATSNDNAIRKQVRDLMAEVAEPDRVWNTDDLVASGIPRRYATSLARESVRVTDAETARAVADDYADEIITDLHRFDGASPRDLAANIGPW